jgi:hypothetical protein
MRDKGKWKISGVRVGKSSKIVHKSVRGGFWGIFFGNGCAGWIFCLGINFFAANARIG